MSGIVPKSGDLVIRQVGGTEKWRYAVDRITTNGAMEVRGPAEIEKEAEEYAKMVAEPGCRVLRQHCWPLPMGVRWSYIER